MNRLGAVLATGTMLAACGIALLPACSEQSTPRTLVIAHRGFAAKYPENTLAAVRAAVEVQADFIEIDIHQASDGTAVVMHDPTLERTTNGHGRVEDHTWAELEPLDAGTWFSADSAGEAIPKLEQVISLVCSTPTRLVVEIKNSPTRGRYVGLEADVIALLQKSDCLERSVINSYHADVLRTVRQLAPAVPLAYDPSPEEYERSAELGPAFLPRRTLERGGNILSIDDRFVSEALLAEALRQGVPVWVWSVSSRERMRTLVGWGVEAIYTPRPARLRAVLRD